MQEQSIFIEALEKENPADQAAFLDQACAGDSALRQRIARLLERHRQGGDFLESPAAGELATVDKPSMNERPGTAIGPYKLLEQIGEGGFGVVFMAEQQQPIRRKVALKVLKPGMDTRQVVARFEAERQALALMDHPNIAQVHDGGETASRRPYFVMELVRGVPITDFCDQNQLSIRERLELFVSVCQAVQHAHQKEVIHRDLKPSNVMVTLHDNKAVVKVIDFGIAKATGQQLTEKTLFTNFAQMIGTPLYMSPEQAQMSGLDVDTRSDIYSLGVLLYELLTGTTPLDGERFKEVGYDEIRRIIREVEPPKPSTRISTLGQAATTISTQRKSDPKRLSQLCRGELDWIVMKALEKDRNRRYETANGLARDVERYLHDEAVQACPPSAMYRFRKYARRHKGALTAGVVISAALLLTVVVLALSNLRIMREQEAKDEALRQAKINEVAANTQKSIAQGNAAEAKRQQGIAEAEAKRAREQERLARRRFYAAQVNLAYQAWEGGDGARVLELLESQRPVSDQEDLRGFEWYHLWRRCHSGRRWAVHGHGGTVVAFSPDGKTLASGTADGTVKFWDVPTGQVRTFLRGFEGPVSAVAFSPDGKMLASGISHGDVWLWDVTTTQKRGLLQAEAPLCSLAFAPDGKRLACGHGGSARLWDLETGRLEATLPMHVEGDDDQEVTVAFSPEGKTLACCGGGGRPIRLWDVATRREHSPLAGSGVMAYCPDGKTVAAGGCWERVQLLDVATGKPWPNRWRSTLASALAYSPDGQVLAVATTKRNVLLWDIKTGQERILQSHHRRIPSLAFSPDGQLLASASEDGTIELWQVAPVNEPATLQEPAWSRTLHLSAAFSPDGKILAVGGRLWETATQKGIRRFAEDGKVAFSADGKLLALGLHDDRIKLFHISTGKVVASLTPGFRMNPLVFSPDGKTFASGTFGVLAFWGTATWQERGRIPIAGNFASLAFSPDGTILAAGSADGGVHLLDPVSGRQRLTFHVVTNNAGHLTGVWSLAFSPDGGVLAVGDALGNAGLWDPRTGELRISLKGHTDVVASLAFSPDGKTLITGSHDGTVKIWDVATGQERATLKGHPHLVECVAMAPDGKTLVAGGNDGSVRLWRAATDAEATARKTELDPDAPGRPLALIREGDGLGSAGRFKEAYQVYCQALSRLEKLTVAFPNEYEYRKLLADTHLGLGRVHADSKQWEDAAGDFGHAAEVTAEKVEIRYWEALARVGAGDLAGYRGACATMLKRFGETDRPDVAHWVAWTSVLAPDATKDWDRLVKVAETAARNDTQRHAYATTLGAALYRAGRFAEAIQRLDEASAAWEQAATKPAMSSPAYTWFFLAIAHKRSGHPEEARRWLDKAIKLMEQETQTKGLPWNRGLTMQALRREAEALLGRKDVKSPHEDTNDTKKNP
jgi:WD40 repeat protein/serine/threonine protein kinase